jgi:2-iminoacetate synthase ThiH
MTPEALEHLVRAAGREPVERDTLYNVIRGAVGRQPSAASH